mgnify:CR=1 FL=1|jgi:hypothetical protein
MSLPSSGPISITQIYQECGGLSTTLDQNIANIRDNLWVASMQPNAYVLYDDQWGFATAEGSLVSSHPLRYATDVDLFVSINAVVYDGYQFNFETVSTEVIQQYSNIISIFGFSYSCFNPGNCYINYLFAQTSFPANSGDYVYSTKFDDYYGKTRYNIYDAGL